MNLLILGGTVFLGRAVVEAARQRGHTLTLFNRGQSRPGLFADVEQLHGDRSLDLSPLAGRRWDAVVDTCGYVPRLVRKSAEFLAEAVERYVFISSLSVYADSSQPGIDESAATGTLADESVETVNGETYGPLKALCERAAEAALPGRTLTIRPGLIVGPYDPTDRFTYWPQRVARGGEVLAPGRPARLIQFIDVRDLAEWTVRMIEGQQAGIYNADQPPFPMGPFLETCQAVSGSEATFTWVSEEFLAAQKVGAWIEMPLWVPESDPSTAGFFTFSSQKAIAAGLAYRPVAETVRATLEWASTRPADHPWRAGLSPQREAELLAAWKQA